MLIPEYKSANAAPSTAEFTQLTQVDEYKKLRAATTDKIILVLFTADWDESSRILHQMVSERVRQNFAADTMLFNWVDCDLAEDLVDHFDVESVPSLVLVMPHKQNPAVVAGVTPDQLTEKIEEMDKYIKTLFEQEKQLAFREIDDLVKNNPCMMFIKGTLDAPFCKFTKRLVATLRPREYRNIKTFNIMNDDRIRQWLKFYTQWPTFPQVYVEGVFQGGLDVVLELIEEGDFDDIMPAQCRKIAPKDALTEFLTANKVVIFVSAADQEATERLASQFEALSVTHARVELAVKTQFQETLVEHSTAFGYRGAEQTQVYVEGQNLGTATELIAMQDLASKIPAGCIRESLEQRLGKLVKQHQIMLFMKGNPQGPQCQFSTKIVNLLNRYVGTVIPSFGYFDIFQDEEVRNGLKQFSRWPTFPQLYVNGTFIGGLDVCIEMDEEGELEDALTTQPTAAAAAQ